MWQIVISIVLLGAASAQLPGKNPRSLLGGATAGPVPFAESLAANGVPAGLVVTVAELQNATDKGRVPALSNESIERAIALFNRRPHAYQAASTDGVTLIAPRVLPERVRRLLTRSYSGSGTPHDVYGALIEITELLQPDWRQHPIVGAHPSLSRECESALARRVTLTGTSSLEGLLKSVSKQARGIVWNLAYDEADPSSFFLGFVCQDGSLRWTVRAQ